MVGWSDYLILLKFDDGYLKEIKFSIKRMKVTVVVF